MSLSQFFVSVDRLAKPAGYCPVLFPVFKNGKLLLFVPSVDQIMNHSSY